VRRGDIVLSVDGRPAAEHIAAAAALASGSPQWRLVRARRQFGAGPVGSNLVMRVRRGSDEINVTVARGNKSLQEFSHPAIARLDDGIYYIDLARATLTDIDATMARLAAAPGVVFDVRRRPNANHAVLSHLLARPDEANAWGSIAHVIRPDHVPSSVPRWDNSGWALPVLEPHISGRVAFLTGPTAISYAETVMSFVEHYHLGAIVGASTAGTNGNIAEITLPTECRTTFTGARVTKLDGSRLHLIGIQPTIPAVRTIAGVIAGRDEVLEKALAYIRGVSK
jgi:C-terminal processing protease CtpA/Prc